MHNFFESSTAVLLFLCLIRNPRVPVRAVVEARVFIIQSVGLAIRHQANFPFADGRQIYWRNSGNTTRNSDSVWTT